MLKVVIHSPEQKQDIVREIADTEQVLTIGRHSECDIILSNNGVSRKHARLLFINGTVFIEDIGSSLGTMVNNCKIEEMTE